MVHILKAARGDSAYGWYPGDLAIMSRQMYSTKERKHYTIIRLYKYSIQQCVSNFVTTIEIKIQSVSEHENYIW